MSDNFIALMIIACGVGAAVWLGGSTLAILVSMAVTACAFAGLYGATGYKTHRFFVISLALSAATVALGRVAL